MEETASGEAMQTGAGETRDSVDLASGDDLGALVEKLRDGFRAPSGEERALQRVRAVAHLMDDAVEIPGTGYRVGLDPILGVLPVGGDAVSALISCYPIVEAYRLGASRATLAKMLAVVGLDFTVGSIPVLGTLVDALLKANERNLRAIERLVEDH